MIPMRMLEVYGVLALALIAVLAWDAEVAARDRQRWKRWQEGRTKAAIQKWLDRNRGQG